jgi:phosphomannomutase
VTELTPELIARVRQWSADDPDSADSASVSALLASAESGDEDAARQMSEWFGSSLQFGTAGLRGPMRPGPSGMNRVVVAHASWGVGQFLRRQHDGTHPLSVVIGYDARNNSTTFAHDAAQVIAGLGLTAVLFESHTPTPVVAFAVRHLGADAGIMITASHNPPGDNGYKVYLGGEDGGSQIIPPSDAQIESLIQESYALNRASDLVHGEKNITFLGRDVIDAYTHATLALAAGYADTGRADLVVSYTPLHGVGAEVFTDIVRQAGFTGVSVVSSQAEPDGSFPTVSFPNPEESGTLDLAHAHATNISADLVIAHDPDADRLAVSLPERSGQGGWQMLTGNELGVLLLDAVAGHRPPGTGGTLARSLVTTPMIDRVAHHHGLEVVSTPTGFKWISRAPNLVAGCEEALGYLVNPDTVRDKDGISAGLLALLIAAEEKAFGRSLADRLATLRDTLGGFASGQVTLRASHVSTVGTIMQSMRDNLESFMPGGFGHRVVDYRDGLGNFPASNIVTCETADGSRIIFRPSGTEPKLKVYLDVLATDQSAADSALNDLRITMVDLLRPFESDYPGLAITSS